MKLFFSNVETEEKNEEGEVVGELDQVSVYLFRGKWSAVLTVRILIWYGIVRCIEDGIRFSINSIFSPFYYYQMGMVGFSLVTKFTIAHPVFVSAWSIPEIFDSVKNRPSSSICYCMHKCTVAFNQNTIDGEDYSPSLHLILYELEVSITLIKSR